MDNSPFILLVEDDRRTAELMQTYLSRQGYRVEIEPRGDRAPVRIVETLPDLVILDLMLPGMEGLSVCRMVRPDFQGPILILTAKEEDMDQVAGLEMGADDYVKKPIEPRVLLARIRALLRRVPVPEKDDRPEQLTGKERELRFGCLYISLSSREVEFDGNHVSLTTAEFDMLWYLASHAGQVLERETIFSVLRGIDYDGTDRSMDVRISQLRKKLYDDPTDPRRIKTVWGVGYQFVKDAW